jgi:hypothetical protein
LTALRTRPARTRRDPAEVSRSEYDEWCQPHRGIQNRICSTEPEYLRASRLAHQRLQLLWRGGAFMLRTSQLRRAPLAPMTLAPTRTRAVHRLAVPLGEGWGEGARGA